MVDQSEIDRSVASLFWAWREGKITVGEYFIRVSKVRRFCEKNNVSRQEAGSPPAQQ